MMFTQWYKGGNSRVTPASSVEMTIGAAAASGPYGICYGYTSDPHYLGMGDAGSLSFQYLRDVRDPANPKIVRIADIIMQQSAYLVIGWEPIAGIPDPSWPAFTWKMVVNGTDIYDFTGGGVPSIAAPCTGRYLTVGNTIPWNAGTVGQTVNIRFV